MLISIIDFALWMDGSIVSGAAEGNISGVAVDTREIAPGNAFFAFKGSNSDGHLHLVQAQAAGAAAVVVCRARLGTFSLPDNIAVIAVDDVEISLGAAAAKFRRRFSPLVTAVTGSVGKTTTREMICAAISSKQTVLTNKRNFNNEIGVPLTLFNLTKEHSAAVIEMGMRGRGQIEYLCRIVAPSIGVITNVGFSHIESLGSQDAIADAKSELFDFIAGEISACAIYNGDDSYLVERAKHLHESLRCVSFGVNPENDIVIVSYQSVSGGGSAIDYCVHGENVRLFWSQSGVHNAMNGAAALAVACEYGIPALEAVANLASFQGLPMRLDTHVLANGAVLVNDAYNASPDSSLALLNWMNEREAIRKILVFGDMLELGEFSAALHEKVGNTAADAADLMICIGEMAALAGHAYAAKNPLDRCLQMESNQQVIDWLDGNVRKGDLIVLKASRGMHFEEIAAALK